MIRTLIFLISVSLLPSIVFAQDAKPDLSAFSPETRKEYEETQKFINETESKLGVVRSQTEARVEEIEALANRVGDIISKMSSQGEDNSALQSEISVLNELLVIERKTTADLRGETAKLSSELETITKQRDEADRAHKEVLSKKEIELQSAEQRLKAALASAASREKTNNVLVTNVEKLTAETERLKKQVKILKENRFRRRTTISK